MHDPLADSRNLFAVIGAGRHGIDAPMNKHSEACFAPPFHARISLSRGLVRIRIRLDNLRFAFDIKRNNRHRLVRRIFRQGNRHLVVGRGVLQRLSAVQQESFDWFVGQTLQYEFALARPVKDMKIKPGLTTA